jgi:hypothetical protein
MNAAACIRFWGWLLAFGVAQACSGCGAIELARGTPGIDVSQIQPGVTRAQAEAVLGKPKKDWISPDGVHYFTYEYDTGRPPNVPDAAGFVFMDLLTFGLWEVIDAANGHPILNKTLSPSTSARVVISYDDGEVARGIFGEFDTLPANGQSGPYSWRK